MVSVVLIVECSTLYIIEIGGVLVYITLMDYRVHMDLVTMA